MKIKKKTEIKIETENFLAIRKRGSAFFPFCAECGGRMLAPDDAAFFFGTTARAIYRRVEKGELHFIETETGGLLICVRSFEA